MNPGERMRLNLVGVKNFFHVSEVNKGIGWSHHWLLWCRCP